ncbi:hypothetical protein Tco_1113172 [Tanacetum coccineum]|uniref:Reverse transcriptase domain-containing protein n=1 Tax=Tanacetum coccineum TaxID=301880 RepID=A0ABQ5IV55_9ASTR
MMSVCFVDELMARKDQGCSYKEFLACNPKEYDGKGGDVVLTHWIEKMEYVHDMSGCSIDQKVKYTAGSFVGKALTWQNSQIRTLIWEVAFKSELWNHTMVGTGHAAYTNRFHELARLAPHLVTPKSRMIERFLRALTNEAVRNGSIKKVEIRGHVRSDLVVAHASTVTTRGHLARGSCRVCAESVCDHANARNPMLRHVISVGSNDHVGQLVLD